jgi:hypothetical protein
MVAGFECPSCLRIRQQYPTSNAQGCAIHYPTSMWDDEDECPPTPTEVLEAPKVRTVGAGERETLASTEWVGDALRVRSSGGTVDLTPEALNAVRETLAERTDEAGRTLADYIEVLAIHARKAPNMAPYTVDTWERAALAMIERAHTQEPGV